MTSREDIFALWDELSAFPAAEIDHACLHLMRSVAQRIGADNAAWVAAVRLLNGTAATRDALNGWRVKTITFLHPPQAQEALLAQKILADKAPIPPGMPSVATAKLSGTFRIHRLHDGFIDLDAYRKTDHYCAYHEAFGVDDRMWVGLPIGPETESYFVFDKRQTTSRFSKADAELAGFALRGLTWFQRQLFLSHGLHVAQQPLTPTERRVLQMLLTDHPEKEIADKLGQSPHTTHDHVKEIYRKFGVKGRAALMAVWLAHH